MAADQLNVEYWFRLLYECFHGGCYGPVNYAQLSAWLADLWVLITGLGYILSIVAIAVIVYTMMRLYELRKREDEFYGTLELAPSEAGLENPRWKHIQSLMDTENPSDWRNAIVEADILLDDMLRRQGYPGEGVGEKLKSVDPADFKTLQDAWAAHKVRNQIAHQGSAFDLSETLARRTIAQYESVFREFELV